MRRVNWTILILVCLIPVLSSAQVELTKFAGRGKVGTTGFQFLKIGVGARAVGMAESFVSLANDATAMYYNPAGLTQLQHGEVVCSLIKWPADISYGVVGVAYPLQSVGTVGFMVGALTTGDMKKTVPFKGWTGEYFSATDWIASVSYAKDLTDKFTVGGNLKMIAEYLGDENLKSWAFDFGTMYEIGVRNMKFAMMITNFGPNAKYISEEFSMPTAFKIGFIVDAFNFENNAMVITAEGSHPNDNVEQVALGFEYKLYNLLALRGGYRSLLKLEDMDRQVQIDFSRTMAVEEPLDGFSFGAGIDVPIGTNHIKLDYAYSDMSYLQNAQRLTVSFNF
ncbi:PorV/PorQ family protein [candidate division KSB1 bacterium]|nr:PorV/PorQ family protein [candidate division KSB1 bacterium]